MVPGSAFRVGCPERARCLLRRVERSHMVRHYSPVRAFPCVLPGRQRLERPKHDRRESSTQAGSAGGRMGQIRERPPAKQGRRVTPGVGRETSNLWKVGVMAGNTTRRYARPAPEPRLGRADVEEIRADLATDWGAMGHVAQLLGLSSPRTDEQSFLARPDEATFVLELRTAPVLLCIDDIAAAGGHRQVVDVDPAVRHPPVMQQPDSV